MPPQEQDAGTQQHQAEAEVETSLIVKLDYWTMPPQEQDAGKQQHQAEAEVGTHLLAGNKLDRNKCVALFTIYHAGNKNSLPIP
jgi:hypothetical protein